MHAQMEANYRIPVSQKRMEIVESCMVTPAGETPRGRIWLSNLDLIASPTYTPVLFIYRPTGNPDFFSPAVLKAALGKALVAFYPVAGRLEVGCDGRAEINCTGDGVIFEVARSGSIIDDFGGFAPSPKLQELLVPKAVMQSADPPFVVFMFQVTFFKCGGVCLSAAAHHQALDGFSALNFINTWARIAKGGIGTVVPPFFDRSLLGARSPPSVLFDHMELVQKLKQVAKMPFEAVILRLSKKQVESLKSQCSNNNKVLSTFKCIAAHLWRCTCLARNLGAEQETRVYLAVDARSRLIPPLPAGYIGNTSLRVSAVATSGELVSNSIGFSGEKIGEAIGRVDDEYVRSLIDFLETTRGENRRMIPATDLWIVSWQAMPIYEEDFGWGRPTFMGRAVMYQNGFMYVLRAPEGDGGITVVAALELQNMERFKKLFYEDLG